MTAKLDKLNEKNSLTPERYLYAENLFEKLFDVALNTSLDILLIDKRHLKVYLCELRLSVSSEILVAETSCKLDIPVIT